jgi:thiamine biosynthesis lipoprotein
MFRAVVVLVALLVAPAAELETGYRQLDAKAPVLHRYEAVEPHMGTLVKIVVYTRNGEAARQAFRAGFDRVRELDATLSDYKIDSELNRLASTAVRAPAPVGRDLFAVLTAAQEITEATGGAFDITQGPVIRLWRDARKTHQVPDAGALAEAARRSGYRQLHLDASRRTVMLDRDGMALDVGGIAKGYAASEALGVLSGLGVGSAMVAISGDLAFSDAPPGTNGWRIALHDVPGDAAGVPATIELTNAALSTAGPSEQYVDAGGRRYSHIVDPATSMGLTDDLTVTVIATHGLTADGLDTAMSVLGAERGLALIEGRADAAALIVRRHSAGASVLTSSRFFTFVAGRRAKAH